MFYQIKKIACFSLAASLGLTIAANKAEALTFGVSYGVLNDTHTAEGSIQIKDSSLSSKATNLTESDFEDWEIAINNSKGATKILTPRNSSIHSFPDSPSGIMGAQDSVTFSNKEEFRIGIDYDDMIRLATDGRGVHLEGTEIFVPMNQESLVALPTSLASTNSGRGTPVDVPFGVSSNTSIIILGGLYGASRLRKKLSRNG